MNSRLPKSVIVNGKERAIRYQYTAILDIISAMNDPELEDKEKVYVCLYIFYENFDQLKESELEEAFKRVQEFMDSGVSSDRTRNVRMVDFEQDARIMFPAINRVAGKEIRNEDDIHWWTFLGWFMEMGECSYSSVLNVRSKKAKGKKLEKWEEEFYKENKAMCDIQPKLSKEEIEAEERLNRLLS